jgi:hypothetical protein
MKARFGELFAFTSSIFKGMPFALWQSATMANHEILPDIVPITKAAYRHFQAVA